MKLKHYIRLFLGKTLKNQPNFKLPWYGNDLGSALGIIVPFTGTFDLAGSGEKAGCPGNKVTLKAEVLVKGKPKNKPLGTIGLSIPKANESQRGFQEVTGIHGFSAGSLFNQIGSEDKLGLFEHSVRVGPNVDNTVKFYCGIKLVGQKHVKTGRARDIGGINVGAIPPGASRNPGPDWKWQFQVTEEFFNDQPVPDDGATITVNILTVVDGSETLFRQVSGDVFGGFSIYTRNVRTDPLPEEDYHVLRDHHIILDVYDSSGFVGRAEEPYGIYIEKFEEEE